MYEKSADSSLIAFPCSLYLALVCDSAGGGDET